MTPINWINLVKWTNLKDKLPKLTKEELDDPDIPIDNREMGFVV